MCSHSHQVSLRMRGWGFRRRRRGIGQVAEEGRSNGKGNCRGYELLTCCRREGRMRRTPSIFAEMNRPNNNWSDQATLFGLKVSSNFISAHITILYIPLVSRDISRFSQSVYRLRNAGSSLLCFSVFCFQILLVLRIFAMSKRETLTCTPRLACVSRLGERRSTDDKLPSSSSSLPPSLKPFFILLHLPCARRKIFVNGIAVYAYFFKCKPIREVIEL